MAPRHWSGFCHLDPELCASHLWRIKAVAAARLREFLPPAALSCFGLVYVGFDGPRAGSTCLHPRFFTLYLTSNYARATQEFLDAHRKGSHSPIQAFPDIQNRRRFADPPRESDYYCATFLSASTCDRAANWYYRDACSWGGLCRKNREPLKGRAYIQLRVSGQPPCSLTDPDRLQSSVFGRKKPSCSRQQCGSGSLVVVIFLQRTDKKPGEELVSTMSALIADFHRSVWSVLHSCLLQPLFAATLRKATFRWPRAPFAAPVATPCLRFTRCVSARFFASKTNWDS